MTIYSDFSSLIEGQADSALLDSLNYDILTKKEKVTLLIPELANLESKADSLTVIAIASAMATLNAAKSALFAYLNTLSPAWNDITQDSPVNRSTLNTLLEDYKSAIHVAEESSILKVIEDTENYVQDLQQQADALVATYGSTASAADSAAASAASASSAQTAATASQTAATNATTAQTGAQSALTAASAAQSASQTAATNAQTAATNATTAKVASEAARDASVTASTAAEGHKTTAQTAATTAQTAATNATSAKVASEAARDASVIASTAAEGHKTTAQTAATNAAAAQTAAQTARTGAESARDTAIAQATGASGSATAAAGHAATATTKASEAAGSATAAAGSATVATTKANEASGHATTAQAAVVTANSAASNAGTSASAAQLSAVQAQSNASARGLTPNAHYDAGTQDWFGGFATPTTLTLPVQASYQGASNVLVQSGNIRRDIQGKTVPIQTNRKYRLYARVYSNGAGGSLLCGFASGGPNGVNIGPNGGLGYPVTTGALAEGWHEFISPVVTGVNTTVNTPTAFRDATTVAMKPVALMNYNNTAGQEYGFDYFYIADVTEQENAAESASAAATSASNAAISQTAAGASASSAATQATIATTKAGEASTSATQASTSATTAAGHAATSSTQATNAASSASAALGSANAASTSASTATTKASEASTSAAAANTSALTATTKAGEASTSATNAATSATTAAGHVATSATNASNAASSASAALGSANAASGSASTASTKASEAATSATAAQGSATLASTKAGEASTSATQASTSATTASGHAASALTQANNAAASQSAALGSANAASGSAATASTKASEAATSATSAATQATIATTKAGEASTSATQASNSATTASGHAATASTQATNAANSANASGASATAASGHASTASTKASEAATSAASALSSKVSAEAGALVAQLAQGAAASGNFVIQPNGNNGASEWEGSPLVDNDIPAIAPVGSKSLRIITDGSRQIKGFTTNLKNRTLRISGWFKTSTVTSNSAAVGLRAAMPGTATAIWFGNLTLGLDWTFYTFEPSFATDITSWAPAWDFGTSNTGGGGLLIWDLKYEDITSEKAAQVSASAAATSATTASAQNTAAGQSATSAQASATLATTKAGEAATSATQSSNSATTAQGHAATASTQATNAATSASTALGHANSASGSASTATTKANEASVSAASALSSKVSAEAGALAAQQISNAIERQDFNNGDRYWVYSFGQNKSALPTANPATYDNAVSLQTVAGIGQVLQCVGYRVVSERKTRPVISGQKIRVRMRTRLTEDRTSAGPHFQYIWLTTHNTDGSNGGYFTGAAWSGLTVADGWVTREAVIDPFTIRGAGTWVEWRLMVGLNGYNGANPYTEVQQIQYIEIEDVTSELAAQASASAAATSATTAAAQNTLAGQSASAAQVSATLANTKAGEASTSASQASTSATNAAGHAATASTAATNAAASQSAALGSANAASGSASTASTKATEAATSATSAQSFSVSADAGRLAAQQAAQNAGPTTFVNGELYFTGDSGGAKNAGSFLVDEYGTYVLHSSTTFGSISQKKRTLSANGKTFKVRALMRHATGTPATLTLQLEFRSSADTNISSRLAHQRVNLPTLSSATPVWVEAEFPITVSHPFVTAGVLMNYPAPYQAEQRIYALELIDITSEKAAQTSASSAATSAATATAQNTAAGQSATAAQGSATTATTKAGEASVSQAAAAVSESNAATSAVSAATSATLSATYRNQLVSDIASQFPRQLNTALVWVGTITGGLPSSFVGNPTYATPSGPYVETSASQLIHFGGITIVPGRTYKLCADIEFISSVGASASSSLYFRTLGSDWGHKSNTGGFTANTTRAHNFTTANERKTLTWTIGYQVTGADTILTQSQWDLGWRILRPMVLLNRAASHTAPQAGVMRVHGFWVEDVTAESAATVATTQAASASAAATTATSASTLAATYRDQAQAAQTGAQTARTGAETAATNASTSATTATSQASLATSASNLSATYRDQAQTAATNASTSATAASGSATTASTKATEASTSAAAAAASSVSANTGATNAANSAAAAATSASNAAADRTATEQSATAAQTSATNAATSASGASTSAGQASTSATNAAGSSASAATQATNAANSANAAGTSASAASTSATNASTSATAAATSASVAQSNAITAKIYGTARGLTPNANFDGVDGWTYNTTTGALPLENWNASYEGRSGVVTNAVGSNRLVYSRLIPVDPTRKYRVRAGVHTNGIVTAATPSLYIGYNCWSSEIATVGANSGHQYVGGWVAPTAGTSGWFDVSSNLITGTGTSTTTFHPGTNFVKVLAFLNYNANATQVHGLDYLYLEDVTESENAASSATAASTSQVTASNAASAASTSATTAATHSTNAGDSATAAAGSATAANANASTATTQASVATAQAAAAQASQTLIAGLTTGHLNQNSKFVEYSNANIPTGWANWSGAVTNKVRTTNGNGSQFPYMVRVTSLATTTEGFLQNPTIPDLASKWVVFEAEVTLNAGSFRGAGVHCNFGNANYAQLVFMAKDASGVTVGEGVVGKRYRFSGIVQVPATATGAMTLYAMGHYNNMGNYGSLNGTDPNDGDTSTENIIDWHECGMRYATAAEIRDKTVLRPMEATVATQATTLATLSSSLATLTNTVSTQGSTVSSQATALTTLTDNLAITNANVATAQTTANTANTNAAAAQTSANTANAALTDIANDNLLTPDEKPRVIQDRDAILAEQTGIESSATSHSITTEKTAYTNAVTALTTYLSTLTTPVLWSNLSGNTTIVGTTFRTKFGDVYTAKQALLNKIADAARVLANTAQTTANTANTNAAAAQTTANTASAAAIAAQTSANTANTAIANIASDNLLTPDEKPRIIQDRDTILAEQSGIETSATSLSITTEKTTYTNAVSALTTYLATLTTPVLWSNLAGDTTIVGTTFRTKFGDVYTAKQALLNKIAAANKLLADNAQSTATTAQSNYASLSTTVAAQGATITTQSAAIATTEGNVTSLLAKHGVTLDVNGFITGYQQLNNGTSGIFKILNSVFEVSGGSGAGLRWSNGVLWNKGTSQSVILGQNFGTTNNLLFYAGPNPSSTATASKSSAVFWVDNTGAAYFGGSLSAGILKNSAQSTSIASNAELEVGPFGTSGGPIVVVTSYNIESQSPISSYPATLSGRNGWDAAVASFSGAVTSAPDGLTIVNGSRAVTASVVVRVDRNGVASWATLTITSGTETIYGVRPVLGASEGTLVYTKTFSGSITSTDSVGGTGSRTFKATITTRAAGVTTGTITSQNMSIVATEE